MSDNRRTAESREIVLSRIGLFFLALVGIGGATLIFSLGVFYGKAKAEHERKVAELRLPTNPNPPVIAQTPPVDYSFQETLTKPEAKVPTAPVASMPQPEVKAETKPEPKVESKPAEVEKEKEKPGKYSIQVGAFREKHQAEDQIKKLQKKGYQAFLGPTHFSSSGRLYRVWVGKFENKDQAHETEQRLQRDRFRSTFVVNLSAGPGEHKDENSKVARRTGR